MPRVGTIDFYGFHKVPEERVRKVVGVREGDRLPGSKSDIEDKVEHIPGVVLARLEAVCCEGERAILYVGIEERDAPHFEFREPPNEEVLLPESLVEAYHGFLQAFEAAARIGDTGESTSDGHELAGNLAVREYQLRFLGQADDNLPILRQVLRNSINPEHRAIAAYVIGYARTKQAVVNDLQFAMQDPDESVRANAMRSLTAIADLSARRPELGLRVQPTWFIEMLNSIVWSDRFRAAKALVALTESRPPEVMAQIRERALPALVEMAQWKTPAHALPAFILVGRLAGMPDTQVERAWTRGDRMAVIQRAVGKK